MYSHSWQFVGLHEGDVQCTPQPRPLHALLVQVTLGLPTSLSELAGIGEADGAFKASSEAGHQELSAPNIELVFEGLDSFGVVTLVSKQNVHLQLRATRDSTHQRKTLFPSRTARTLLSGGLSALRFVRLRLTRQVSRTENQFVTYRVDVKDRLVKGTNELVITFPSTFLKVSFVRFISGA